MKIIALLLVAASFLMAADTPQTHPIFGEWQWVKSKFISRGLPEPKLSDPKSRGYTVLLKIQQTDIEIIKNNKSVGKVPYLVYKQGEGVEVIRVSIPQDDFPFFISSGPIYFKSDTLIIAGTYNDAGEDQYYVRE